MRFENRRIPLRQIPVILVFIQGFIYLVHTQDFPKRSTFLTCEFSHFVKCAYQGLFWKILRTHQINDPQKDNRLQLDSNPQPFTS